jgi:hyperosmotically inducible protein
MTGLLAALSALPLSQALAQEAADQTQPQSNRTVPDKAADGWITTKVKSEFATTKGIPATAINVDTMDGRVTLSGVVTSAQEKMKAVTTARQVKGVKSVDASGLAVGGRMK